MTVHVSVHVSGHMCGHMCMCGAELSRYDNFYQLSAFLELSYFVVPANGSRDGDVLAERTIPTLCHNYFVS